MIVKWLLTGLLCIGFACVASAKRADEWLAAADQHERAGNTRAALEAFLEADKLRPDRAEILVSIARQYGDLMTELKDDRRRREAAEASLRYSRRALALAPGESDPHLAVAISLGKKMEFMGNRQTVEASREIKQHAERALALNPRSDYAHHMLGRWHQGLAGVGGAKRAIARIIYGGLPQASYEEALRHFERARALRPGRLLHEIEYGRTLAMLDRKNEARNVLNRALAAPARDKDDDEAKQRARETLAGI